MPIAGFDPSDTRGFTLVEAIVVAAILAILSAVAIPSYTNYVRSQKREVARGIAQSGAAAANIYFRRTGNPPPDSASLNLFLSDPARYTVAIQGNFIVVTDVSNPADTLIAAVKYQ
jgi:prepilin-type N-terminal cleavage/methylation domain-containing protein